MLFRGTVTLNHLEDFRIQIPSTHRGAGSSSGVQVFTQLPRATRSPTCSLSSPQGQRQGPSHTPDPTLALSGCQTPSLELPETHSPGQPTCCHIYVPSTFTGQPVPSEIHTDLLPHSADVTPQWTGHILAMLTAQPWAPCPNAYLPGSPHLQPWTVSSSGTHVTQNQNTLLGDAGDQWFSDEGWAQTTVA